MLICPPYIKKYSILILVLTLIGCNKTDWNENYKEKKKSPFGTYIVFNEAKALFKGKKIHYLKENIYDYLFHNYIEGGDFGNYICIKNDAFKLNESATYKLLDFVYEGNNAFLSLNYFSKNLKDTLKFTTNNLDENIFSPEKLKTLKGTLYLKHDAFKDTIYQFDRNIRRNYIVTYNEKNTIVLGTSEVDGEKVPNFIKIYHGKGAMYVHTNPVVFTNFYMLNGHEEYAENLLSYLPTQEILWDPQIKSNTFSTRADNKNSIFKFFLQHPSLKWFLMVTFFSLLLFMLFNARRKQRPIPIIEPLKNSTVEFTHTIANLYLKEKDHKNLVDKKIVYFLEKIRLKYLINTASLDRNFIKKLAAKSGNNLQRTKYLINTINTLHKKSECTEEELFVLNKMIENFLKK